MLGYQNIKTFLQNATFRIGVKKFFVTKKLKTTVLWTYVSSDLNGEEIIGKFHFIKKNCKKQIKQSLELTKKLRMKVIKLYVTVASRVEKTVIFRKT